MRLYYPSLAATLIAMAPVCIAATDQAEPVAHLFAPPDDYTARCDPLIAEAAMRLVSAELAARRAGAKADRSGSPSARSVRSTSRRLSRTYSSPVTATSTPPCLFWFAPKRSQGSNIALGPPTTIKGRD